MEYIWWLLVLYLLGLPGGVMFVKIRQRLSNFDPLARWGFLFLFALGYGITGTLLLFAVSYAIFGRPPLSS
jgi:hypothetical protein